MADVWGCQFNYKSLSLRGLCPPARFDVALLERVFVIFESVICLICVLVICWCFFSWIAQRISLLMEGSEKCNRSEKKERCVCEWERDGQFKWIKLNLSYSFPLITPYIWAGIWFSQVLLNWLLIFEWESDNVHTHNPFLHIFFFSVVMSKDIWALSVHIWADDHGATARVAGLPPQRRSPCVINIPPEEL